MNIRSRAESGIKVGGQSLHKLISEDKIPFNGMKGKMIPDAPGVYLIFEKDNPIYAGKSTNLRRRVCYKLSKGNKKHYLAKNLIKHRFHDKIKFQNYLTDNCSVQCIETENADEAQWMEHFIIGTIRPIYNGGENAFEMEKDNRDE